LKSFALGVCVSLNNFSAIIERIPQHKTCAKSDGPDGKADSSNNTYSWRYFLDLAKKIFKETFRDKKRPAQKDFFV